MLKKTLLPLVVAMAVLPLAACNDKAATAPAEADKAAVVEPVVVEPAVTDPAVVTEPVAAEVAATQSIGDIAAANPDLTVLTAALKEAGLDTMMMDAGTYTVFAPTDAAFEAALTKLKMTKEELLANKDLLKSVLTYHVLPAVVKADGIPYGTEIDTANGQKLTISADNVITDASGNMAKIVGTDIMATNGVIHTIDTVLIPKS